MRNQCNYFEKILRILKELKEDYPDIEVSKHYSLATDGEELTDSELYNALQKHKGELDMNTVSEKDLQELITQTEDLFTEIEVDDYTEWERLDEEV